MTRQTTVLRIVAAAAVFVLCYAGVLALLINQWATNPTYSYGFAVPLISGYVVWSRWKALQALDPAPDYAWGGALVLLGVVMLSIGRVGALVSLQATSMIVTLAGLVLILMGRRALRLLWFAIAYLLLMLPLWGLLINWLEQPSQEVSASIAAHFLRIVGVPTLQQGTTLVLSSVSLDVMPECSGINQLIALTVMALPAAYLWLYTSGARVVVLSIAVIAGYLCNGMRIALLGLLTSKGMNVSDPHTLIHLLPGFATAAVAYLTLWACLVHFAKFKSVTPIPAAVNPDRAKVVRRRTWLEVVTLVGLLCVAAAQLVAMPLSPASTSDLREVPNRIAGWTLESSSEPSATRFFGFDVGLMRAYPTATGEHRFVAVDDELLRTYRNPAGKRVQLYVGYYRNQQNGKELTGDASRALHKIAATLSLPVGSDTVTVKEVVQETDQKDRGVVFWYDVNGRVVPSIYRAKAYTLWDALTRRRTNGAVIMIGWDARDGRESGRAEAMDFAESLLPLLRRYLPS
jgi:EpsI family protein